MLVRSGARKLELFDDDILSPGNLVRNELDWRGVGAHKVKALRARLLEIAPEAKVTVQIVSLGGQESSEWTATALETLANCDLMIDATADATVFGLAAAAARFKVRPMVWGEVFGGGISVNSCTIPTRPRSVSRRCRVGARDLESCAHSTSLLPLKIKTQSN